MVAERMEELPPLSVSVLTRLGMLAECVQAGRPITYLKEGSSRAQWGIARAFTREGGGFLAENEDVRLGFVWMSGGTHFGEVWVPVMELVEGIATGNVALDYRGE